MKGLDYMKNTILFLSLLIIVLFGLSGCSPTSKSSGAAHKISTEEAKEMMDSDDSIIILDVRTQEEYDTDHIPGAILIPYTEITKTVDELIPDHSSTILLYCRSGRRSSIAASDLVDLGYSNVYDFGGISDWEYEVYVP